MAAKGLNGERHRVALENNAESIKASSVFDKAHYKRNIRPKRANCAALCLGAVYMRNGAFGLFRLCAGDVFISSAGINFFFNIRKIGSDDSGELGVIAFGNVIRKLSESSETAGTDDIGNNGYGPDSRIEKFGSGEIIRAAGKADSKSAAEIVGNFFSKRECDREKCAAGKSSFFYRGFLCLFNDKSVADFTPNSRRFISALF